MESPTHPPHQPSSYKPSAEEIRENTKHLWYEDFECSPGVVPWVSDAVIPKEGFRYNEWKEWNNEPIPVVMASVTRQKIFEVFLNLLKPLGDEVDVVLERSDRHSYNENSLLLWRREIESIILQSIIADYEELLVDDGMSGIFVVNPTRRLEVGLDTHKILHAYGHNASPQFDQILEENNVPYNHRIRFLSEGRHLHTSSETYQEQFERLVSTLEAETD